MTVEAASASVAAEGFRRGQHPERTRLRALELVDAGWSWERAAREVGVAKSTVQVWIVKRQRDATPDAYSTPKPSPAASRSHTASTGEIGL